jgi:hypothetical protein
MWIKNELGALVNIGRCEGIVVDRSTTSNPNGEIVDMGGIIRSYGSGGRVKWLITTYKKEADAEKIIERIEKALKAGETLLDLSK